jgi:hypothetical protein
VASAPANGDNGAYVPANMAGYLGTLETTAIFAFGDGAALIGTPYMGNSIPFAPASGTQNIFALIEARAAYTPTSGEVFTLSLDVE